MFKGTDVANISTEYFWQLPVKLKQYIHRLQTNKYLCLLTY